MAIVASAGAVSPGAPGSAATGPSGASGSAGAGAPGKNWLSVADGPNTATLMPLASAPSASIAAW